jgi:hypothetical protein
MLSGGRRRPHHDVVEPPAGVGISPTHLAATIFRDSVKKRWSRQDHKGRMAAVKRFEPPSVRCTSQDIMQTGLTLADL